MPDIAGDSDRPKLDDKTQVNSDTLARAVTELTQVVQSMRQLLEQYPNRDEVHDNFVSKTGAQRRLILFLAALLVAVLGCFLVSVGTYSACFIGDTNRNGVCQFVPGAAERLDRREEINRTFELQEERIEQLERIVGGLPASMTPPPPATDE